MADGSPMTTTTDRSTEALEARRKVRDGQRALAAEQWVEAARCFLAALELSPRDGLAWYGQALALEALGQPAGAKQAMQRAVALDATLAARGVSSSATPLPSLPTSSGIQVPVPERTPRAARPDADVRGAIERLAGQNDWAFAIVRPRQPVQLVSGGEWVELARPFAERFREQPMPVVPILGRTEPDTLAAWLGALMAGRSPTLLSYPSTKIQGAYFAEKIARYRQLFGGAVVVGHPADRVDVPDLLTAADLGSTGEDHDRMDVVEGDQQLFVQCSSGTTGLQKAVGVTRDQLEHQVRAYAEVLRLDANTDRIVSWLPLYHDMGLVATLWLPLLMDVPVVFLDPFEWAARPAALYEVVASVGGTLVWQPNFAYSLACRTPADVDLTSVRAFVSCAEPIAAEVERRFLETFPVRRDQLAHCYALAENVFAATQSPIGEPPRFAEFDAEGLARGEVRRMRQGGTRLASCGRPISGVDIRIDAEPGHIGEILLRGPCTVDGYLGRPPERSDGWMPTGDLGFLEDGELFVTGRLADQIVSQGRNLQPHDLEQVMNDWPGVHPGRTMAAGVADRVAGTEQVWALFEPAEGVGYPEADALSRNLADALQARFLVRADVSAVPRGWLRKTSSGKIARRANVERRTAQTARHVHVVGDSHVQVLWRTFREDHYRAVHAHWVGHLWADAWSRVWPLIERVARHIRPEDVFVVSAGEAECRRIFGEAADPAARIAASVDGYAALFDAIRNVRPEGPLVYATGIPTRSHEVPDALAEWSIVGELPERLANQAAFYGQMREWCAEHDVIFADLCTPFARQDGTVRDELLHDGVHLDPTHRRAWVGALTEAIGLVDLTPAPGAPQPPFQGAWADFRHRCRAFLVQRVGERAFDEDRLVTDGWLDSVGVVEFVGFLAGELELPIDLLTVRRTDFDSLRELYDRWVAD